MTRDSGAASVEFALVVPLFVFLVGVAGFFAWHVYTESQLERAAQRAARYAAVPATDGTYAYRHCDVVAAVNDHLPASEVAPAGVAVNDAAGALPATTCPDTGAPARPRGYVHVRVTHVLDNPFSNVLSALLGRPDPMTITGSGEARVEDAP
ncbi:MAG TPA: TadE family protein [Frankiaceae bacterium]|nr:TadE family protein [Frankiaceae bacterium]